MKLGTVRKAGVSSAFSVKDGEVRYHQAKDVLELISQQGWTHEAGRLGDMPAGEELAPPVLEPRKIICVGLNYTDHAKEVGKEPPAVPTLFAKVATTLVGAQDPLEVPSLSTRIDWEAELAIVIGSELRDADETAAAQAILGYSVVNDLSIRDWQNRTSEWFQGKNFDRTCPFGPVIVTPDELDIAAGLAVTCSVNGVTMQSGSTSDMIFSPVELLVYISQFLTLQPGDVIATGTPAGVGFSRTPPLFLAPGDEVATAISGIGELRNTCIAVSRGEHTTSA